MKMKFEIRVYAQASPVSVVLCPTRELAMQIDEQVRNGLFLLLFFRFFQINDSKNPKTLQNLTKASFRSFSPFYLTLFKPFFVEFAFFSVSGSYRVFWGALRVLFKPF